MTAANNNAVWILLLFLFYYFYKGNAVIWKIDNGSIPDGYNKDISIYWKQYISLARCAAECYMTGNCLTMAYDPSETICRHYNQEVTPETPLTRLSTNVDFYKAYPCLRPDYTYRSNFNACIKIHWSKIFTDATATCENEGGQLLAVNTSATYNLLQQVAAETGTSVFWLGAQRDLTSRLDWYWQNGDLITNGTGGQYWLPAYPKNNSQHCLSTRFKLSTGIVGLRNRNCSRRYSFICDRPLKPLLN